MFKTPSTALLTLTVDITLISWQKYPQTRAFERRVRQVTNSTAQYTCKLCSVRHYAAVIQWGHTHRADTAWEHMHRGDTKWKHMNSIIEDLPKGAFAQFLFHSSTRFFYQSVSFINQLSVSFIIRYTDLSFVTMTSDSSYPDNFRFHCVRDSE